MLARQLGYDAEAVSGLVGSELQEHGWVEIVIDGETEGYILRNTEGQRNRPIARNYISPIPSGQISLYKSKGFTLTQNKEWE